jgi:type VI secretion system secreted protein Hcp
MPTYMGVFDKPNVLSREFRGEVKAAGFEGWIELQTAQLGQSRPISMASGGSTNRETGPTVHEIQASKFTDSTSTALFKASLDGKGKLVIIAFVKEGSSDASLTFVLQDAIVASYVPGSGDPPRDSFTLNFTTITFDTSAKSPNTTHSQVFRLGQQNIGP